MPNILPQEIEQIKRLRDKVVDIISPYYDTDFNLLRWLKKYNFDFIEALLNLRAHLDLRNSNYHLDKVMDGRRDHPIHKHWQITITGNAVKTPNSIVCIEQTGHIDYWGILHTFSVNEIMNALIYDLENMLKKVMEQEAKTGEQTSILFIMDLYGLQYNAHLLEILQGSFPAIVTFMSEHYEEIIQCFLIVNAPLFMSAIWTIVSPFLSIRTKNKVKILGSNWKDEILEMVIPNVLPSSWNIPGQDPIFLANIPSCLPCLPDFYYKGDLLNNTTEVLWVSPGKTGCIDIKVIKNSLLKWTFEADGHFAFAIFFTEDCTERSGSKVIYPVIKKIPGPTYVPLQDSIVSQHAGVYKFWFSNEHAWLHTLKVRYGIDVTTVENG